MVSLDVLNTEYLDYLRIEMIIGIIRGAPGRVDGLAKEVIDGELGQQQKKGGVP